MTHDLALTNAINAAQAVLLHIAEPIKYDHTNADLEHLFACLGVLPPELLPNVLRAIEERAGEYCFRTLYVILAAYQFGRVDGRADALLAASKSTLAARAA